MSALIALRGLHGTLAIYSGRKCWHWFERRAAFIDEQHVVPHWAYHTSEEVGCEEFVRDHGPCCRGYSCERCVHRWVPTSMKELEAQSAMAWSFYLGASLMRNPLEPGA